jgi:FixJ family two-component response regulator
MANDTKPKIAVVDDDFRVRESIQSLIESAGYSASVFALPESFLTSHALVDAACLITDVRMPKIDGLELNRRVKAQRPELPVIFVSAHLDEAARERAFQDGAAAFLYKPFDAAELLATIETALNKDSEKG